MAIKHKSEIKLTVSMDENRVPEELTWDASDGGVENEAAKAFLLSVWDKKSGDTLAIDLWTKDMLLDDMKRFFHQTFVSMANSFERATDETSMAADMRDFAHHFAEKMNLIKPNGQ